MAVADVVRGNRDAGGCLSEFRRDTLSCDATPADTASPRAQRVVRRFPSVNWMARAGNRHETAAGIGSANEERVNKPQRCFLHLACIAVKLARGKDVRWHCQHILREFGLGEQCAPVNVKLHNTTCHALLS